MDCREFYRNVDVHEELEWLGALANSDGTDCVYVANKRLGSITEAPISAIKDHDWETWLAIMLGHRPAKVMKNITRIVGYYSELQNWNASKLAELRDRRNGNYGIPSPDVERAVDAA